MHPGYTKVAEISSCVFSSMMMHFMKTMGKDFSPPRKVVKDLKSGFVRGTCVFWRDKVKVAAAATVKGSKIYTFSFSSDEASFSSF